MDIDLEKPVVTDRTIRSVNFFNGRLLSAEDLNLEKSANREGGKQLGQAIGTGVAYGLEVTVSDQSTAADPRLVIQPGLAINPQGKTLGLLESATLPLRRPPAAVPIGSTSRFDDCLPPQSGIYIVDEGVYLLTIEPAESNEGRTPVSGLHNSAAACNVRHQVETVQFRLLSLTDLVIADLAAPARLRNRVAHRCFGTADARLQVALVDPFEAAAEQYGLLDDLRAKGALTRCAVPLAVIHWTRDGMQFVDMWSVRRRLTRPATTALWSSWVTDRRMSEAEAMFLQFQDQVADIRRRETTLATVQAVERFDYLPPLGVLPLTGPGTPRGFDFRVFLAGLTTRDPVIIEGAQMPLLVQEALLYPPVDLSSGEMFWLYAIRQNRQATDQNPFRPPPAYLVFASGHLPYRGDARYDINRWTYSNFALRP